MRTSEWIQGGFAALLAAVAWVAPLTVRRRVAITVLAAGAIAVIALGRLSEFILAPRAASILRDWLPVPLMLIPYWQTGQFFKGPDLKIQAWLVDTDRWFFRIAARTGWDFGRAARLSMEWAYSLCYALATLGLATLYFAELRRDADAYWYFVLIPTYLCYVITPFFPALPPRSLNEVRPRPRRTKSRVFNLWILKYGSIQAISFPSAHVASSLAVALVLLRLVPAAGAVFLLITFWIAVAAVVGGYHYAIDVVLGAAVTALFYLVWRTHLIPSSLVIAPAMAFPAIL
jgi:membrane-associated phospholipid phosphatase